MEFFVSNEWKTKISYFSLEVIVHEWFHYWIHHIEKIRIVHNMNGFNVNWCCSYLPKINGIFFRNSKFFTLCVLDFFMRKRFIVFHTLDNLQNRMSFSYRTVSFRGHVRRSFHRGPQWTQRRWIVSSVPSAPAPSPSKVLWIGLFLKYDPDSIL